MIYDCFIFYNELMMLDLRLNALSDDVDKFVIVESDTTFSGAKKPLMFEENKERFAPFLDRIEHVVVSDTPDTNDAWTREAFQRNAMMRGLHNAAETDIVMFSDLDEIPNVPAIVNKVVDDSVYVMQQKLYYYGFNLRKGNWRRANACRYGAISLTPEQMRNYRNWKTIHDAGWHFSYVMPAEKISEKIKAFSHQEFNKSEFTDVDNISSRIGQGLDLFGRGKHAFKIEALDNTFPQYLVDNPEMYQDFIFVADQLP